MLVHVDLFHSLNREELLAVAQSMVPVPAN